MSGEEQEEDEESQREERIGNPAALRWSQNTEEKQLKERRRKEKEQ